MPLNSKAVCLLSLVCCITHAVTLEWYLPWLNTPLRTIFIHFGEFLPFFTLLHFLKSPPSRLPSVRSNFSISTCQLLLLLLCHNSRDPPAGNCFHPLLPFPLATPSTSPRAGRPVSMYSITPALALAAIRGPGRANPSPDIDPGEVGGGWVRGCNRRRSIQAPLTAFKS